MTVDAERGILYMPFAAPAFDRYGGDRHGDNLFSTLDRRRRRAHRPLPVALPGRSPRHLGQRPAGSAAAVRRPHRRRNRARGGRELEERLAVLLESCQRRTDSRDRGASRARQRRARRGRCADATLSRRDAAAGAHCRSMPTTSQSSRRSTRSGVASGSPTSSMVAGGLYHPVRLNQPTISFPGLQGGNNWGGGAYDPTTGLALSQHERPRPGHRARAFDGSPRVRTRARRAGASCSRRHDCRVRSRRGDNCTPSIRRRALVRWQATLGVSDNLPVDKQDTGRPNVGGPIVTAGGLVFIGATDDNRFRAFDARERSPAVVAYAAKPRRTPHRSATEARTVASIVAVTATGGSFLDSPVTADTLVAFALPRRGAARSVCRPQTAARRRRSLHGQSDRASRDEPCDRDDREARPRERRVRRDPAHRHRSRDQGRGVGQRANTLQTVRAARECTTSITSTPCCSTPTARRA